MRRDGLPAGQGQALVEFVMVVVLFVFMLLFALQVAELNMARSLLNVAAYSAARKFAITQEKKKALEAAEMYIGEIAAPRKFRHGGEGRSATKEIEIEVSDDSPNFGGAFKLTVYMKHMLLATLGLFRWGQVHYRYGETVVISDNEYAKCGDLWSGTGDCWVKRKQETGARRHWWVTIEDKWGCRGGFCSTCGNYDDCNSKRGNNRGQSETGWYRYPPNVGHGVAARSEMIWIPEGTAQPLQCSVEDDLKWYPTLYFDLPVADSPKWCGDKGKCNDGTRDCCYESRGYGIYSSHATLTWEWGGEKRECEVFHGQYENDEYSYDPKECHVPGRDRKRWDSKAGCYEFVDKEWIYWIGYRTPLPPTRETDPWLVDMQSTVAMTAD